MQFQAPSAKTILAVTCLLITNAAQAGPEPTEGMGLIITDTRQACWQLDQYLLDHQWKGNREDPPPCIGPNCQPPSTAPNYPTHTLEQTIGYIETVIQANYIVLKIADNDHATQQIDNDTIGAFAQHPDIPVYGYHKLGSADGAVQANALINVFQTWPHLTGFVIVPGDDFYAGFDSANPADQQAAASRATSYVQTIQGALGTHLQDKCIMYAPEGGGGRVAAHQIFATIPLDGIMPRTFWHKSTVGGDTSDPLGDVKAKEQNDFRVHWGILGTGDPSWWRGKPLILWAQTDMMDQENQGHADRIKPFVDLVKKHKQQSNIEKYYPNLKGVVVWEFAHMNRKEIKHFPEW